MHHLYHSGFQSWELGLTAVLMLTALVYIRGWVEIHMLGVGLLNGWHAISFLVGLCLTWLATASPISTLDHEMLTVHMVQHLLLMTLIPPLIWLGNPGRMLARAVPQQSLEVSGQSLRWTAGRRLGRAITQPAVCWLAAAGALIGWHVPFLFALGMRSGVWHGIEQASFLLTGLLFWWPVIHPRPSASSSSQWTILLYLFLATLPCDILSGFLVFCDRVVYPFYSSAQRPLGFSALQDQQCAGALMWTCVTVVYLIAGTIFAARLLSPETVCPSRLAPSDQKLSAVSQKTRWTAEIA